MSMIYGENRAPFLFSSSRGGGIFGLFCPIFAIWGAFKGNGHLRASFAHFLPLMRATGAFSPSFPPFFLFKYSDVFDPRHG